MKTPTERRVRETPTVFELKGISFCYEPNKYVLKDISMMAKKGEIVALVGSNGSGKSTRIKILLGFYPQQKDNYILKVKTRRNWIKIA